MQILNQIPIMEPILSKRADLALCITVVVLFVMALWFASNNTKASNCLGILCTFLFCLCMACLLVGNCKQKPTGRYQYECLIDDETSCAEIYDKYDVVDRRGEIWVLEDKNE